MPMPALPPGFELEDDFPPPPPGFELEQPPEPPKPGIVSRVLGAGAAFNDRALGALHESNAAWLVPGLQIPKLVSLALTDEDARKLRANETTMGDIAAERMPEPEPTDQGEVKAAWDRGDVIGAVSQHAKDLFQHEKALGRTVVREGTNLGRDPLTWAAGGAMVGAGKGAALAARLAGAGSRAQRVAEIAPVALGSAMFTVQAGQAVPAYLREAHELYLKDGGWTPRVTEKVAGAVIMAGATTAGVAGTIHATGGVVKAALPDRGGATYRGDTNARPGEFADADAAAAESARLEGEAAGVDASRIDAAGRRLLFERSAALEPQTRAPQAKPLDANAEALPEPRERPVAGMLPEAPEPGTPQGQAMDIALARAQEGLASGTEPAVGRVTDLGRARVPGGNGPEYQGPVGQADIAPHERAALQTRLLELWRDEGGPVEAQRQGPPKVEAPEAAAPGIWEKAGRAFVRTIEPAFAAQERMPGVGRELAGRERAFVQDWELRKGQLDSEAERALQSVGLNPRNAKAMNTNPLANQLYRYLDGLEPLESVPEAARPAAESLHKIQQTLAAEKVKRGIIDQSEVLEFHWPRKTNAPESFSLRSKAVEYAAAHPPMTYEQALTALQENSIQVLGRRTSKKVTSSQERNAVGGLKEGEYRTDFGAFFDDIRESAREIAEHDHLGKNGQDALNLAARLEPGSLDKRFTLTLLDRLRGAEPQGLAHKVSSAVRSIQSGIGLVSSPITQLGTLGNTAAETSLGATAKAISDTFLKQPPGPDGKPMNWSRPVKRLRAALNEARLDAERQGATNASVAEGLADFYLKTAGKDQGLSARAGRLWHIRGTGWTDNLMRVIAAKTAPHIVPKAWEAAKAGDVRAQRTLDAWHVDWRKDGLTPDMLDTAARRISERSQFKVGMGDIPLWASSPLGKVAFQFQSFGYAHTQFVGRALDEARQGNVAPLAKLMTVGAGMGYLTNEAKRAIFGGQAPENPTEDDFATAASAAFSKGRHYDTSTPRGAALAYIEGLGAAGGVGALQGLSERASSGSVAKIALGATGADVDALARAGKEAMGGKVGRAAGRFVEGVLPTGPLGINPRAAMREAMSEKPIANPGYTGRLMDAAGVGPGAAARVAEGEMQRVGKASKREADAFEAEFPKPKAEANPEKRLSAAKRRAERMTYAHEIARAVSRKDEAAVDAIVDKAFEAGIEFDDRDVETIHRRVLLHLPPLAAEEEN